jgi:hypothetical protein
LAGRSLGAIFQSLELIGPLRPFNSVPSVSSSGIVRFLVSLEKQIKVTVPECRLEKNIEKTQSDFGAVLIG